MNWPLVTDSSSRTALAYGVYGAPETFFIDRSGIVRDRWTGPITYERLTDEITRRFDFANIRLDAQERRAENQRGKEPGQSDVVQRMRGDGPDRDRHRECNGRDLPGPIRL